MPSKRDMNSTTGTKLLRLFLRLMTDRNKHFQTELAEWLNCSKQTVIRLVREIEGVVGERLQMGMDNRRRWYRLCLEIHPGSDCRELCVLQHSRSRAFSCLLAQFIRLVEEHQHMAAERETGAWQHDDWSESLGLKILPDGGMLLELASHNAEKQFVWIRVLGEHELMLTTAPASENPHE